MDMHPRLVQVQQILGKRWIHLTTAMGAFGGPTEKATNLYSDSQYVHRLRRSCTAADHKRFAEDLASKDPVTGQTTGGTDLKESQAYPEEYGRQVAKAWKEHWEIVQVDSDSEEESSDEETLIEKDSWSDAKLAPVCDWLGLPIDKMACKSAFGA